MLAKEHRVGDCAKKVISQMGKVIVGKNSVLLWILATVLARGHVLIEDIPGVGKTTLVVALSKVLDLSYNRVQFTPDVLPSDVTGFSVLDHATGAMTYTPGAVLCNLFLADELNRATSRTQSALLEAMEEGQVTVDGVAHKLPQPFVVIATQNPTGAAGTQLLPDSQLDRFTIRIPLGYPTQTEEKNMVLDRQGKNPMEELTKLLSRQELAAMQEDVDRTYISEAVVEYAVRLVSATRNHDKLRRGASPRATLCVVSVAKALAQLQGRDYVVPKDVQEAFLHTVPHRLLLTDQTEICGVTARQILQEILEKAGAPLAR